MLSFSRYNQPFAREKSAIVNKLFAIHGSGCYYCTTSTASTNNIMCLDGGKFHIDRANAEAYDFFIECYAEDIMNGIPHYIVEKNATAVFSSDNKTRGFDDPDPIVNFFCELDIQRLGNDNLFGNSYPVHPLATCFVTADEWNMAGPTPLDKLKGNVDARKDFVRAVVGIMFGVIARSYCDQHVALSKDVYDALECVVADHHGDAKGDSWQAGFHLHFPKIRLRLSSIAILTHAMSHALQQHMPVGKRENAWTDRLDKSPYRCGSGLRLVGSYKAKPCPDCGSKTAKKGSASHSSANRQPVVCETCFGVQFVHMNRRYMPWLKLHCINNDQSAVAGTPRVAKDPRCITTSFQDAISRTKVSEEVLMEDLCALSLKALTSWIRMCSTKAGIPNGTNNVYPRGFVGDSTYALIPAQVTPMRTNNRGKAMKVIKPAATTSDTEYVVAPEPIMKPPTGLKNVGIIPDTTAERAVSELVSKISSLFDVSYWGNLEVRNFKYFTRTRATKLSNAAGDENIYVIINLKGQGMRYCTNKHGHHSKNVIYFEVHTAKMVEENLLSSMSCLSSSQDKLRTSKRVAFIVQRCYSAKKNASGTCRTYSKCAEYPLSIEERIFPPHVKATVSNISLDENCEASAVVPGSQKTLLRNTNSVLTMKRMLPDSYPLQRKSSPSTVIMSSNMSDDSIDSSLSQFSSTQESTVSRKRVNRGTTPNTMAAIALLAKKAQPLKE